MIANYSHKIFNDPIYGFITIQNTIILELIEHSYFQRLRRILQLGFTNYVYLGANHTRFQHTLGAMYLTKQAVDVIRNKGIDISPDDEEAVIIAILLHDIGHGPFSHTLENYIVKDLSHEDISKVFMQKLNQELNGKLNLAIDIFNNRYEKKFLHQLVNSQLDMDRLDYLKRDSFFTGVLEGAIGSERIIKMLTVANGELVIEKKGIYSIEKFLIARRLMYWQVYLHKTVISAELLLIKIFERAKLIASLGKQIISTPSLSFFIYNNFTREEFFTNSKLLLEFSKLDDIDVMSSVKMWCNHKDKILSFLCNSLINRNLYKLKLSTTPFSKSEIENLQTKAIKMYDVLPEDVNFFVFTDKISNRAYIDKNTQQIKLLNKNGEVSAITDDFDIISTDALSKTYSKYFLWFPKDLIP